MSSDHLAPASPSHLQGSRLLGALLVQDDVLTPEQLESALEFQRTHPLRLGEVLKLQGVATPGQIAKGLSRQLSLPFTPGPLEPTPEALEIIPGDLARRLGVLPLRTAGRSLVLAVADPLDVNAVEDVRFRTGRAVEVHVVAEPDLRAGLDRGYGGELEALLSVLDAEADSTEEDRETLERVAGAAPVVRLVDGLLGEAWGAGASDLHLEPVPEGLRARVRVDGVLREIRTVPASVRPVVLSRLKIMAGMDIAVRRRPQDGGLRIERDGRTAALRVSTLPTRAGEKAVVRVLEPDRAPDSLDQLGMARDDLARVRGVLGAGQGVLLATGPTGSGKSSTLQAALRELDRRTRNVTTLEDPVEYPVPGAVQVQVDPRAGLTFPAALRAVLRQDPDVVMVGEIRDAETAEIAMSAAVTGHLVLSTLHTTDAPSALTRLVQMGVPAYLVAAGVAGVVAQRLVRIRCERCGAHPGREGCPDCVDGYRGRTGVFQVLAMNDRLREAVVQGASTPVIRRLARESGMGLLADDARRQVSEGRTTPHEVARVIRGDSGSAVPCEGCGGEVPADSGGCPWCGRRRIRECRCGRRLEPGWRFCAGCLARVAGVGIQGS
jgi:type IV pilus assembly protein PilB